MKTGFLAQIEMESLVNIKVLFSLPATATNGSSLRAKEKTLLWNKLVMKSWIGFKKIIIFEKNKRFFNLTKPKTNYNNENKNEV